MKMLNLDAEVKFQDPPASADAPAPLAGDEVFGSLLSPEAPAPLRRGLNYSHQAMVDLIVANPAITQNEIARHFGYSVSWISQIINSDAFQARLAERATELRDPIILASMEEQFKGVLSRCLELTREKLAKPEVSDNFLLRSMDLSTRALGYGAKKETERSSNLEDGLLELSNNLVGLLKNGRRNAVTIAGESSELQP